MGFSSVMSANVVLAQMKTIQSAGSQVQGRANVLKSELKIDLRPDEDKKKEAQRLEAQAARLQSKILDQSKEVNETLLKPDETDKTEKTDKSEKPDQSEESGKPSPSKQPQADRVEVSQKGEEAASFVPIQVTPDKPTILYTADAVVPSLTRPSLLVVDVLA